MALGLELKFIQVQHLLSSLLCRRNLSGVVRCLLCWAVALFGDLSCLAERCVFKLSTAPILLPNLTRPRYTTFMSTYCVSGLMCRAVKAKETYSLAFENCTLCRPFHLQSALNVSHFLTPNLQVPKFAKLLPPTTVF